MGATKALLRLNGRSALERVAETFHAAGVNDVVVVVGHDAEHVAAEAKRLGIRVTPNHEYRQGMFTSVQVGVRALASRVDAFFLLPVDCPLVAAETITLLIDCLVTEEHEAVHPTCLGRRGHPPLMAARLRESLAATVTESNLRDFLRAHVSREYDLETNDLCILLDMDTASDHELLDRLAFAKDLAQSGRNVLEPRLTCADAEHLLSVVGAEERVIRHCRAVARVAAALAEGLNERGADLDVELTRAGALLHDMAKGHRRHAIKAEHILMRLGLPQLAEIVGAHMVLPEPQRSEPVIRERELVYLADKLVVEDTPGNLEARTLHALRAHGLDRSSLASIEHRMRVAKILSQNVERQLGRDIAGLLADAGIDTQA